MEHHYHHTAGGIQRQVLGLLPMVVRCWSLASPPSPSPALPPSPSQDFSPLTVAFEPIFYMWLETINANTHQHDPMEWKGVLLTKAFPQGESKCTVSDVCTMLTSDQTHAPIKLPTLH